jgi:hypothetical protein
MKKIMFVILGLIIMLFMLIQQDFVPKFSFLYYFVKNEETETYKYLTLSKRATVERYRTENVENHTSCYDESYFYDNNKMITYLKYEYKDGFLLNHIEIKIVRLDLCKDELSLDKDWVNDVINVNSSNFDYLKLFSEIQGKEIIHGGIIDFDDSYYIQYGNYFVYFTRVEDRLGIIQMDQNDHKKYGFYQLENAEEYLIKENL